MKKHTWLSLFIILAVLMTGGYLINGIYTKMQRKSALRQFLVTLPAFQFTALDSSIIRPDYIPTGRPIVLLFFSPDCEYCQAQAQGIKQYMHMFSDVQLLWIADGSTTEVRTFAERYAIESLPNSKVVTVPFAQIKGLFGINQLPAVLIYDRQRRMLAQFRGETKWEAILNAINEQVNIQQ